MSVPVPGRLVAIFLVFCAILAYFVLASRLAQNLAVALALFGGCIVGMFVFALRLATEDKHRHVD